MNKPFDEYVKPGDFIDQEMYNYFMEVLPPETLETRNCVELLQSNEPVDNDGIHGEPRFDTFISFKSLNDQGKVIQIYQYKGAFIHQHIM